MSENEELKKQEKIENQDTVEQIVEQLEDVDFEKEFEEKKKKSKVKNIIILIVGILLLAAVGFGAYYFISRGTPENVVEDFVLSFNSQDYGKMMSLIDLEGFYALSTTADDEEVDETTNLEKYYTKFDERYEKAKSEEDCKEFVETISEIDTETLTEVFEGLEMTITEIEEPVLIQNTKGLYKISINMDMTAEGETVSDKYSFYVNRSNNEYKIVGGEITESILYIMLMSEYYSSATSTLQ